MPERQLIRIFLSSPGDVSEERRIVHLVVDRLRTDRDLRARADLKVIAWDDPESSTAMIGSLPPQVAINMGMPRPAECEVVLVIVWSKMGTPTHVEGCDYLSGTHFELADALAGEQRSGGYPKPPHLLIYRRTQQPTFSNPDVDKLRESVEQYAALCRFLEGNLFFDDQRRPLRGVNPYPDPAAFEDMLEKHLKRQISMLLDHPSARPVPAAEPAPPVWEGSPFPGLRPFTETDEPIFFGRVRETTQVIDLLRTRHFVGVVGASGSGKSSLVGAGVIPRLRANVIDGARDWVIVRFTPGELGINPLLALAERTLEGVPMPSMSAGALAQALVHDPDALDHMLKAVLRDRRPHAELLFFVDQFEELITVAGETPRAEAITLLARLAAHPRARVLVTLRADFYNRVIEHEALARLLNEASYALAAPGTGALYEMITRPAERAALHFEDGLPDRILNDTGSDPGALPLLAFALDALYRAARAEGRETLTHAAYSAIGGVQGAIARLAEETYAQLDLAAADALPRVFQELIRIDNRGVPTRARAPRARFADDAEAIAFIDAFIEWRLLLSGTGEDNEPVVEVAHEALFRAWGRLVKWITEAAGDLRLQDAVAHAADEWAAHNQDPAYLWANSRNAEVSAMIARRGWQPSPRVQRFIRSEADRLLDALRDPATPPAGRREIGVTLAVLGDPRPGVGVLTNGLPDIAWRTIVTDMGATQIAAYPVTIAQFRAFTQDPNGFHHPAWWDGLTRSAEPPPEPTRYANQPMTGMNWHEAVAFTRWLAARTGQPVRLPTTNERVVIAWSRSATSNTLETGLGGACAVGLFPPGAHGLYDLDGNVREWGWDTVAPLAYPRLGMRAPRLMSLFGASFDRVSGTVGDIACADPDSRRNSWGFRLAMGGVPPESADDHAPEAEVENVPLTTPSGFAQVQGEISQQTALYHLLRLLPRFTPPPKNPNFALVTPPYLDTVLSGLHDDAARLLRAEVAIADQVLLRPFSDSDYDAVRIHIRYRLIQLSSAALIIVMIALCGVGLWLAFSARSTPLTLALVGVVGLCLLVIYISGGGRANLYNRYMNQRRSAEWLRREYFRFLARLAPYNGTEGDRHRRVNERAAHQDAAQPDESAAERQAYAAGQPTHLYHDRRIDEAIYRLVWRGLYDDSRVYFRVTIDRYQRVLALCRRIIGLALLVTAVCAAAAVILFTTLAGGGCIDALLCGVIGAVARFLIIAALTGGAVALLFLFIPLLYQWERLIAVFQASLLNLETIGAASPLNSQPIADDGEYRREVESFTEAVLRVLEEESAQYGQRARVR